ncbi:2075_t:CDS:2, partial [Paraglomus brasilianum]
GAHLLEFGMSLTTLRQMSDYPILDHSCFKCHVSGNGEASEIDTSEQISIELVRSPNSFVKSRIPFDEGPLDDRQNQGRVFNDRLYSREGDLLLDFVFRYLEMWIE